jgi:hypothetical protein
VIRNSHANIGIAEGFHQRFISPHVTKSKWLIEWQSRAAIQPCRAARTGEKGNAGLL